MIWNKTNVEIVRGKLREMWRVERGDGNANESDEVKIYWWLKWGCSYYNNDENDDIYIIMMMRMMMCIYEDDENADGMFLH